MDPKDSSPAVRTAARERIVRWWQKLGGPAVDAKLLSAVTEGLFAGPGLNEMVSPAVIARVLADEGAELRHPDIIELTAQWRAEQLKEAAAGFSELEELLTARRVTMEQAEGLITKLELLRQHFESANDESGLSELTRLAVEARTRAQAVAQNHGLSGAERVQQAEIDQWLKVWLQTPALFKDWLELRRRSEEFRKKFVTTSIRHADAETQTKNT